jgi:hypothetical protein
MGADLSPRERAGLRAKRLLNIEPEEMRGSQIRQSWEDEPRACDVAPLRAGALFRRFC